MHGWIRLQPCSPRVLSATGRARDSEARKAASKAQGHSEELEARLNRALLIMEALWTLLRDNTELSEADLADRMLELDSADGRIDGRTRREPAICERCNRATSRRFPRCLYCGHEVPLDPFA